MPKQKGTPSTSGTIKHANRSMLASLRHLRQGSGPMLNADILLQAELREAVGRTTGVVLAWVDMRSRHLLAVHCDHPSDAEVKESLSRLYFECTGPARRLPLLRKLGEPQTWERQILDGDLSVHVEDAVVKYQTAILNTRGTPKRIKDSARNKARNTLIQCCVAVEALELAYSTRNPDFAVIGSRALLKRARE